MKWTIYVVTVVSVFFILEGHAYFFNAQTLTQWAREVTVKYPFAPVVFFAFIIALGVHLYLEPH